MQSLTYSTEQLRSDFLQFTKKFVSSQDIDPIYPCLKELYRELELPPEHSLWFSWLYVAYYDIASAFRAFHDHPLVDTRFTDEETHYPHQTERRGLWGHFFVEHLESLHEQRNGMLLSQFLDKSLTFEQLFAQIQTVKYNGRWAAFKLCDILLNVHSYDIEFPGMELSSGTSSINKSLELLCPDMPKSSAEQYLKHLTGLRWDQLETCLCDFHALADGRYYIGHDIDKMQSSLYWPGLSSFDRSLMFKVRKKVLPNEYLGELHNWYGVRTGRMRLYSKYRLLEDRDF